MHRPILTHEMPGLLEMKNADKYWTETGASREFGIPATTLRHAWVRGDIETVTTACGLTLLFGPSVRKYAETQASNQDHRCHPSSPHSPGKPRAYPRST